MDEEKLIYTFDKAENYYPIKIEEKDDFGSFDEYGKKVVKHNKYFVINGNCQFSWKCNNNTSGWRKLMCSIYKKNGKWSFEKGRNIGNIVPISCIRKEAEMYATAEGLIYILNK